MDAENMERESNEVIQLEQGQYTMLLQKEMSESTGGTIYFSIPAQTDYLYEYEGDLDQALADLPEIYESTGVHVQTLSPEAAIVVDQIWNYFDHSGDQRLEGQYEYNFEVNGDRLLVLPKDNSGEVVAIARNGQVESTFEAGRFEHLMERFAIAAQQLQTIERQQEIAQDIELG